MGHREITTIGDAKAVSDLLTLLRRTSSRISGVEDWTLTARSREC